MVTKKLSKYHSATLSTIIQTLATPIFIKNTDHNWILVNQAFCDLIDRSEAELIGKSDYDFFPKEQADIFWEKDNQVFQKRQVNINEEQITNTSGEVRHIETKKIVFYDETFGDVLCGVITDITEIKKYQIQIDEANQELTKKIHQRTHELEQLNIKLEAIAYKDALTGLMNRSAFDNLAVESIDLAKKHNHQIAFLFLDMDGLKFVNDSYGHPTGDLLIQEAGQRLSTSIPQNSQLARIGGDEFLVMHPFHDISEVYELAENISQLMQKPAKIINKLLSLSSSIGIACYPDHGKDLVSLFQNADCAMYEAKKRSKGTYEIYQHRFTAETVRKLELENELRLAVENNDIDVYFQPIVNLETQLTCGYEALARWQSDTFGIVSPQEFVGIAEQSELIIDLGEHVLNKALKFINCHCDQDEYVSVNVSPIQLQSSGFEAKLTQLVKTHDINPAQLALEVTENILTEVSENLTQVSESMSLNGVKIFIDDFGTGYSNLMQLRRLKCSALKVDQEFITNLLNSESDRSLLKAIVLMAKELGLEVIAEGIETREQGQCLLELGIRTGQGFYWNKAQPSSFWIEDKKQFKNKTLQL